MKGERVWDEYKKEHFKLKALLFVTITDLPGLGSLSGQVTKGYKGCVVCLDGTFAKFLKHSKKMAYMGHRRFLPSMHPYHKNKKSFNGTVENQELPKFKTRRQIIKIVNKLKVVIGKGTGSVPALAKICVGKNLCFGNCLIGGHCMFGMHLMGCTLPKMSRRACWVL
jgi:hypothetical protein